MSKENFKRAGVAVAVVALKLLPMIVTLSAIVGFASGVACAYLWRTKSQK